jgi:hypothetical protein
MRPVVWLIGLGAIASPQLVAGQVIQLPSFHSFSVDTTVVVPDSGRATIAGDKKGRTGASRLGPLSGNRALAVDRQSTGVSALATIHDPRQADAALRRAQTQSRVPAEGSIPMQAPWSGRTAATDRAVQSVAAIEGQRASRAAAVERETLALVQKARTAAAGGKPGVATAYYQRAASQATGRLQHTIAAELGQMNRRPTVSRATTVDGSAAKRNSAAGAQR